jgi:hypothetical protein
MEEMKKRQLDTEHSDYGTQTTQERKAQAVTNALEITDNRDYGQFGLHLHVFIPGALGTQFGMPEVP